MRSVKAFLFFVFLIITAINTYFIYFYEGLNIFNLAPAQYELIHEPAVVFSVLGLMALFTIIALVVSKRAIKKNFLRASLILSAGTVITSVVRRVAEGVGSDLFFWRVSNTVLYIILFFLLLGLAKSLYQKLCEIYEERNN